MSTEISVDELAQVIRQADGQHSLGAGALAEAILAKLPHLAARQPVGEPVADAGRTAAYDAIDRFLRNNMDDAAYAVYLEHLEALWAAVATPKKKRPYRANFPGPAPDSFPGYAAPPAQAVDLGRFRKLASWVANCAGHGINDSQRRLGEELLALIDGKAAR